MCSVRYQKPRSSKEFATLQHSGFLQPGLLQQDFYQALLRSLHFTNQTRQKFSLYPHLYLTK